MKIVYLHQYFRLPSSSGGTRSYDLAQGFVKSGFEVEIVTATSEEKFKGGNIWKQTIEDGLLIHYIYLPYSNKLGYFKRSLVFLKFIWYATFKVLTIKTDFILATSTPLTIAIPALFKKWRHKCKFVFEARDIWPETVIAIGALKNQALQKLLLWLENITYRHADSIVSLSKDMDESIVRRFPSYKTKCAVIENISEINRFQKGFDPNISVLKTSIGKIPRFTVLYAGTFGRVNGLNYVLKFAKLLLEIDDSIAFVLIGDGAEKDWLIDQAKELNVLGVNVFILPPVQKQKLPQLYFECNMGSSFVINVKELWANSANKFFDTLAAGRPILINHKGWQEDIVHGKNVGFVMPVEIDHIAAKLFADYTRNDVLLEEQNRNSLNLGKERFSLEIALEKYASIFNKLVSQ